MGKNLLSVPATGTEYAANYRIENDTLTMIHTDAGYYTPVTPPGGTGGPSYMHVWYLKDHLGNNRVLADGSGNALKVYHYDPFGEQISVASPPTFPSSSPSFPDGATESPYRYGGKEWSVPTSTYDFEARQFSPSFHRFTSMDPLCEKYYGISPYAYCKNNPINRVEVSGEWDVTIHVFQNRDEYGYGLAIVTNNSGDEVFRFTVRVEGVNGRDRYIVGADTPLGKYKIPNNRPWKSGGSRKSYGFPYRLNMEGVEGEIIDTGRSAIRIHGGRQEYFDEEIQLWIPFDSPSLVKTEGCVRAFDRDMLSFKTIVDGLEETNPKESPGFVTIVDDLVRKTKGSGNYVEAEEYYDVETPVTWQTIWQSFWENGYYYAK